MSRPASPSENFRLAPAPLLAWVLMCVMFLAPLAAAIHGVAHGIGWTAAVADATHEHQQGVPLKACDECMAMAQVQPAPATVLAVLPVADVLGTRFDAVADGLAARRPDVFHSRGPPGAA